jgi:hypothetical protein
MDAKILKHRMDYNKRGMVLGLRSMFIGQNGK